MRKLFAGALFVSAALACIPFAAPVRAQGMLAGLPIDGIRCDTSEGAVEHIHANLQIFNRGRAVIVPANTGIVMSSGCLYWVHTHSNDGMIHIESPVKRPFTLGQFFDIWGQPLDKTHAASALATRGHLLVVTVNGKRWTRDPRLIVLRDGQEIVIQAAPPYGHPKRVDWTNM